LLQRTHAAHVHHPGELRARRPDVAVNERTAVFPGCSRGTAVPYVAPRQTTPPSGNTRRPCRRGRLLVSPPLRSAHPTPETFARRAGLAPSAGPQRWCAPSFQRYLARTVRWPERLSGRVAPSAPATAAP